MNAWKSSLLMPALLLSSAMAWPLPHLGSRAAASFAMQGGTSETTTPDGDSGDPSTPAAAAPKSAAAAQLAKTDIYGFWVLQMDVGLDVHLHAESFYAKDGSYEVRAYADNAGSEQRFHQFGTWTLKGDSVILTPDPVRCKTFGDVFTGCEDTTGDVFVLRRSGSVKTLVTADDGSEAGDWTGADKAYTLPDLLKSASLASSRQARLAARRNPLSVSVYGAGANGPKGFDISGRSSGSHRSAGMMILTGPEPVR